jgi:predicted ATPase
MKDVVLAFTMKRFSPDAATPRPGCGNVFQPVARVERHQGARSWELRTAVDLAALLVDGGRPDGGRALLQPIVEQFVEGRDTADLKTAERLLATLG